MRSCKAGLAAAVALALHQAASGQGLTPVGLVGTYDKTFHARGPTGHLCLTVATSTRNNAILSNTYQHLVTVKNSCSKTIAVKVCYKGSDECKQANVRPYQEETVFLGEMTGVPVFDFDYVEKFQP